MPSFTIPHEDDISDLYADVTRRVLIGKACTQASSACKLDQRDIKCYGRLRKTHLRDMTV